MKDLSIIITAGGIGKRMGAKVPKQFLLLNERPILMHTLERMQKFAPEAQIILTLPEEWMSEWKTLRTTHSCRVDHQIITGGKERFDSVKNALGVCNGKVVMIHDGVRPLFSKDCFERGLESLNSHIASVPFVPIVESMRKVSGDENHAVSRLEFAIIQTPQCFRTDELKVAYNVEYSDLFTDDASVMESAGHTIHLFEGNSENVKITKESDLQLAEFYLQQV